MPSEETIGLLTSCVRYFLTSEGKQEIANHAASIGQWNPVIEAATRHGIVPLLYRGISASAASAVPEPSYDALRTLTEQFTRASLYKTGQLLRLLRIFSDNHVRVISYKGPMLAQVGYGDLGLRQFYDLDLLIEPADKQEIHNVLLTNGFHLDHELSWESHYFNTDARIDLDVHVNLAPKAFPLRIQFLDLWERRRPVVIGGKECTGLALEDLFIVLCAQAAKDRWEDRLTLGKICDIAVILGRGDEIDWAQVESRVELLGIERIVAFGIVLANRVFDFYPGNMERRVGVSEITLDRFIERTRERFADPDSQSFLNICERAWFHFNLYESWRDKLAQVHMIPTKIQQLTRQ